MSEQRLAAVILAAGQGTRMKSDLIKVLHPLGGRPLIEHTLEPVRRLGASPIVVVVGYQRERMRAMLGSGVEYALQEQQRGTGHALLQARAAVRREDVDILVMGGDTPLLIEDDLSELLAYHRAVGAAATMLTAVVADPTGYGRVWREGDAVRVIEEKNASPAERQIQEVNAGVYCFRAAALWPALAGLGPDAKSGEIYLVDVLPALVEQGLGVSTVACADPDRASGVNTRQDLARAEACLNARTLDRLMSEGVTVVDPGTTRVDSDVRAGMDAVIHPFTVLRGATRLGIRAEVGPACLVVDSDIGEGARVVSSVVERSIIGAGSTVGPFAHLRPDTVLHERVKVGNFAELKNSVIGAGSKVPHHCYVGDATVGERVNVGAGTVTVNYDGIRKSRTEIGDDAFIGCNANLVAPVSVGTGAYVAAGATITRDVSPDGLAVARVPQKEIIGWAARRRRHSKQPPER